MGVVRVGQDGLGRAQDEVPPHAAPLQGQRAPASLRVEGHACDGLGAVGLRPEPRGEGGAGPALVRPGGGERAQPAAAGRDPGGPGSRVRLIVVAEPERLLQAEFIGRDRARLIEADHVEVVHRLHGVDVLDDRAAAGEAHGADGEGDGHAQQQALGHDGGDRGGRVLDRVGQVVVGDGGGDEQQRPQRRRRDEQDADDAPEADLQRGGAADELAGVGGELERIGLGAHALRDVAEAAGGAEAAREHGLAGGPAHGGRLAGQQGFVDFGRVDDDAAVGHHLVARPDQQEVALDDLAGQDLRLRAVPHDRRAGGRERLQGAQRARGAQLLPGPDGDVRRDDDADEEGILRVARVLIDDGQDEQDQDQGEEHEIEVGERVLAHHVAVAALLAVVAIDEAALHAVGDLRRAQTPLRVRRDRGGERGRGRRVGSAGAA